MSGHKSELLYFYHAARGVNDAEIPKAYRFIIKRIKIFSKKSLVI